MSNNICRLVFEVSAGMVEDEFETFAHEIQEEITCHLTQDESVRLIGIDHREVPSEDTETHSTAMAGRVRPIVGTS